VCLFTNVQRGICGDGPRPARFRDSAGELVVTVAPHDPPPLWGRPHRDVDRREFAHHQPGARVGVLPEVGGNAARAEAGTSSTRGSVRYPRSKLRGSSRRRFPRVSSLTCSLGRRPSVGFLVYTVDRRPRASRSAGVLDAVGGAGPQRREGLHARGDRPPARTREACWTHAARRAEVVRHGRLEGPPPPLTPPPLISVSGQCGAETPATNLSPSQRDSSGSEREVARPRPRGRRCQGDRLPILPAGILTV